MAERADVPVAVEDWLRSFVQEALQPDEVEQFVRAVDDEIIASIPEVATDPTLIEQLHASTRAHWRNFLVGLSDEYHLALPPAAIALSLSIARRHLDIGVLLKVYRVANKSTFRYLTQHTQADALPSGLPRDEALLTLWQRAEAWIDDSVEALIIHFTRERSALTEGAQARRSEVIGSLISGDAPSELAERILGHPLGRWQTAFVLSASTAPGAAESGVPFTEVATNVCQAIGLPKPLTSLAASRELWGWVATAEPPELELQPASAIVGDAGLHLALGRPCHGPTAFRTSHFQAVAAQRVGTRTSAPCHAYGDIELVALLGDTELTREMIRRELAPLLGGAKSDETLRATALAYLRCGQNVDATASTLFVHPNTVRYRVGRIEEQLGRRIGADAAVLEAGLAWLEVYGEGHLQPPAPGSAR